VQRVLEVDTHDVERDTRVSEQSIAPGKRP
jgi:hypothetical protein